MSVFPIHAHNAQSIAPNRFQAKQSTTFQNADDRFIVQFSLPNNNSNYFEATLMFCPSNPPVLTFGIGLAPPFYSHGMTGWYHGSIGYHSDDGLVYNNHGDARVQNLLQQFQIGDTIGCAWDHQKTVTFSKNGVMFEKEFSCLKIADLVPTISWLESDLVVEVNFGEKPFLYKPCGINSVMGPQNVNKSSLYRMWTQGSSTVCNCLIWNGQSFVTQTAPSQMYTLDLFVRENERLLALWTDTDTCLISENNDAQAKKLKGIIWLPTLQVRPGSAIKGVAMARNVLIDESFEMPQENIVLEVLNPKQEKKQTFELKMDNIAHLFQFNTSVHDEIGQWTVKLVTEAGTTLASQTVELVHFEKLDIEISEVEHVNLLLNEMRKPSFRMKYLIEGTVNNLASARVVVKDAQTSVTALDQKYTNQPLIGGVWTAPFALPSSKIGPYTLQIEVEDAQRRKGSLLSDYEVIGSEVEIIITEISTKPLQFDISAKDKRTGKPLTNAALTIAFNSRLVRLAQNYTNLDGNGRLKVLADCSDPSLSNVSVQVSVTHNFKSYSASKSFTTISKQLSSPFAAAYNPLAISVEKSIYQKGETVKVLVKVNNAEFIGTVGSVEIASVCIDSLFVETLTTTKADCDCCFKGIYRFWSKYDS